MKDSERTIKAKRLLNARGIKSNLQRIKIVLAIETITISPFSIDDLTEYLSLQNNRVTRGCVYYTLLELLNSGIVSRHQSEAGRHFFQSRI
jgi:Fe2+ or Zn2+ uptake regulation protein